MLAFRCILCCARVPKTERLEYGYVLVLMCGNMPQVPDLGTGRGTGTARKDSVFEAMADVLLVLGPADSEGLPLTTVFEVVKLARRNQVRFYALWLCLIAFPVCWKLQQHKVFVSND